MSKKEEVKRYKPKYNEGLSTKQVKKRIEDGLVNKTKIKISGTYLKIICKNIFTFFNILLIIIGTILIIFGLYSSTIFLVILVLNTTIGLVQDIRAKRQVDKLSLIEQNYIKVIRNGKEVTILDEDIVLDDICLLEKDTKIPCDGVIIKGEGNVNESLLTGESLPQRKIINSKVFGGTYVTNGVMYLRVENVGEENYISKLQLKSKEYKKPISKMYIQLNKLFKIIAVIVIIIGLLELVEFGILTIFTAREGDIEDLYNFLKDNVILQLSGSLVSMIPSGMFLLTSTALAVGVIILTNKKVLIKDMYCQETLARVDTLCIDKTGTITDGKLSVFKYKLMTDEITEDRFKAMIASYCHKIGDENDTSKALLEYFHSKIIFKTENYIPFSSVYKYSAIEMEDNGTLVLGAFNFFNLENSEEIEEEVNKYSLAGFRVIVVGLSKGSIKNNCLPSKIKGIGIILLQDHIREEIKESIKWFNENDVEIKVISGDNPLTVYRIAEKAGVKNALKYISLEGKTEEEVKEVALDYAIFGRVTPEQKEIIIQTLKENNRTVAMIGDGINDVLSLKTSDVSIALESGTKASRDISSLVLLNDDFTKLPEVVYQGRRVINNLQRTCSLFLTKTAFSMVLNLFFLIYFLITAFGDQSARLWPFPVNTFYIWEMATIGIASFLLALEPNSTRIKGNFLDNIVKSAIPNGFMIGLLVALLYLFDNLNIITFNDIELLNISTLFISVASFIPLLNVSYPINKYRGLVIGLMVFLAALVYLWSMFGVNWLFINGGQSIAPRYLSWNELLAFFVMLLVYITMFIVVYFIVKFRKNISNLFLKIFRRQK